MTSHRPRHGSRLFCRLLLQGQHVDWKYSLVVILVIIGMFSTPLTLGSIRYRVYAAVKQQIEKENNARELRLHTVQSDAPPLDDRRLKELAMAFPQVRVVGNHKLMVGVKGPEGSSFLTLQTLAPEDPRVDPLRVVPEIPSDFGLTELVVSDNLGHLLYGDAWEDLWRGEVFAGPALTLRINDLPLAGEFQVVARRTSPGRGLYASSVAGATLRRFTLGLGAAEFALPVEPGLLQVALPELVAGSCTLWLDPSDPTCDVARREQLTRRLESLQLAVRDRGAPGLEPSLPWGVLGIELREIVEERGPQRMRPLLANCRESLAPHLVERCSAARVLPEVDIEVDLILDGAEVSRALVGLPVAEQRLLPGASALRDRLGSVPLEAAGAGRVALDLAVPVEWSFTLGQAVALRVAGEVLPARVARFFHCAQEPCPLYAPPLAVFRLLNLRDGVVEVYSREPLVFVPADQGTEYDELLVYAAEVEEVESLSAALRARYPGYEVQYNVAAIDKLERQDSRLSALFSITMGFSALFIILALGALAQINIERRSRQIAQLLVLGFSRRFVRWLVVAEYLLLTIFAALAALGLTALLCEGARTLLRAGSDESGGKGFQVIIDALGVDATAFFQVFAVVALCTWSIALVSARKAAATDPLELLD